MKIELIVGRGKDREVFDVEENTDPDKIAEILLRLSRPYLMSTTIDTVWDPNKKIGSVTVGGFRTVGTARVIEVVGDERGPDL